MEDLPYSKNAHLKSLRIQGFKCFADTTVPMGRLTVLAGGNSVGKSSVIQSLLLMHQAWNAFGDSRHPEKKPIRGEGTEYQANIPLNGNFLMELGSSKDVVTNGEAINEILFSIENHQDQVGVLHFEVPLEPENYLIFTGIDATTDPNPLADDIRHNPLFRSGNRAFYYLNAERIGPRPFYDMGNNGLFETGWQGEYTIQVLSSKIYDRHKIEPEKSFDKSESLNLGLQVNDWMNYIIPGTHLNARKLDEINKSVARINNYSPNNVGFGVSYVLPIIVSGLLALPGTMFIVENPEAHLHPAGQSRIGQFLAQMASAGVQVVVETHSEHVLNGIRIATMKGLLKPDEVAINFFQRNEETENVEIQEIGLTTSGDLTKFPAGFFDQTQQDLVKLITLKQTQSR